MHDGSGVARANQGIPPLDIVQVLSASGTKTIAGTQRGGVWISVDEGAAWAEFNNDRTRREFVLSLQVSEGRLYAGTQSGKVFVAGF